MLAHRSGAVEFVDRAGSTRCEREFQLIALFGRPVVLVEDLAPADVATDLLTYDPRLRIVAAVLVDRRGLTRPHRNPTWRCRTLRLGSLPVQVSSR